MTGDLSHLTLDDMAASARGALSTGGREHLASCGACRGQAHDWAAVAGGLRLLAERSAPPPGLLERILAATESTTASGTTRDRPWRGRADPVRGRRVRAGGARAWLSAAAGLALLGAAGYGLAGAIGSGGRAAAGSAPGGTPGAAGGQPTLTATGCSSLKLAAGTLVSVDGSRLRLRTAGGTVTVTASGSTTVTREISTHRAGITDGTHVIVQGTYSGGTIAARRVGVLPRSARPLPAPQLRGLDLGRLMAEHGTAAGTVTHAGSGGFTVAEPGGTAVRVTTSPGTTVITLVSSSLSQLRTGLFTAVVGSAGAHGSLAADTIEQDALPSTSLPGGLPRPLPSGLPRALPSSLPRNLPSGLPRPLPGSLPRALPGGRSPFAGLGCDSAAIATTALLGSG